MTKRQKMLSIFIGIVTLVVAIPVIFIVETERKQWHSTRKINSENKFENNSSPVLVAYFSRSGNTALMARTISIEKKSQIN